MTQPVENVTCLCGAAARRQGLDDVNYLVNCDGEPPRQYMISRGALGALAELAGQQSQRKPVLCDAAHEEREKGKVYWIHVDSKTGQVVGEVINKPIQK